MKAVRCIALGGPDDIVRAEVPDPVPGPGEILVRVHAAAVNFPDLLIIAGRYQVAVEPPFTCGSELAGVVEQLGDGVPGPPVGTPVTGAALTGAFAERAVLPATAVRPALPGLDSVHAAAFSVTYTTAYHSLVTVGRGTAGESVVVLGAAGGVGSAVVDVGSRLGMRVLAAASGACRLATARELGADACIDYTREDLKTRIRQETEQRGADLVIDPVGGDRAEAALRGLCWGGRFVTVGFAAGNIPRVPLNLVLLKNVVLRGFDMRSLPRYGDGASARGELALKRLVQQGMRPLVSAVYPLTDTVTALRQVAARTVRGKVVIAMPNAGEWPSG